MCILSGLYKRSLIFVFLSLLPCCYNNCKFRYKKCGYSDFPAGMGVIVGLAGLCACISRSGRCKILGCRGSLGLFGLFRSRCGLCIRLFRYTSRFFCGCRSLFGHCCLFCHSRCGSSFLRCGSRCYRRSARNNWLRGSVGCSGRTAVEYQDISVCIECYGAVGRCGIKLNFSVGYHKAEYARLLISGRCLGFLKSIVSVRQTGKCCIVTCIIVRFYSTDHCSVTDNSAKILAGIKYGKCEIRLI